MANMQLFEQYYQANFSSSLKSTRDVWYDFIKNCDELTLKNAMDKLEEVYVTKKGGGYRVDSPTLGEVKREYWNLHSKGNGKNKKFCHEDCAECNGIGTVRVVIHFPTKRILNPRTPEAIPAGELGVYIHECPHAFIVKEKDNGTWFGWSLNRAEHECWIFMNDCEKMYREQQTD